MWGRESQLIGIYSHPGHGSRMEWMFSLLSQESLRQEKRDSIVGKALDQVMGAGRIISS